MTKTRNNNQADERYYGRHVACTMATATAKSQPAYFEMSVVSLGQMKRIQLPLPEKVASADENYYAAFISQHASDMEQGPILDPRAERGKEDQDRRFQAISELSRLAKSATRLTARSRGAEITLIPHPDMRFSFSATVSGTEVISPAWATVSELERAAQSSDEFIAFAAGLALELCRLWFQAGGAFPREHC